MEFTFLAFWLFLSKFGCHGNSLGATPLAHLKFQITYLKSTTPTTWLFVRKSPRFLAQNWNRCNFGLFLQKCGCHGNSLGSLEILDSIFEFADPENPTIQGKIVLLLLRSGGNRFNGNGITLLFHDLTANFLKFLSPLLHHPLGIASHHTVAPHTMTYTYTLFLTRLKTHLFDESLFWHCYAVVFSLYFWRPKALDVGHHSKFTLID